MPTKALRELGPCLGCQESSLSLWSGAPESWHSEPEAPSGEMSSEWHCALGAGDIVPSEEITQGCSLSRDATQTGVGVGQALP